MDGVVTGHVYSDGRFDFFSTLIWYKPYIASCFCKDEFIF